MKGFLKSGTFAVFVWIVAWIIAISVYAHRLGKDPAVRRNWRPNTEQIIGAKKK